MTHKHVARISLLSIGLFLTSFILISLVGAYLGVKGNDVDPSTRPTQVYQTVHFPSQARDKTNLEGWYFPAQGEKTVIILHGWGGHRARLLDLAEYLQRQNMRVLTFDLRGGTGKNSYGQDEAGDLAGAIAWLASEKQISPETISVIGASMGGAAAIVYAAEHPVDSLVLLSPIADIQAAKRLALTNRSFIWPNLYATGASFFERIFFGVKPVNPIDVFDKITSPTLTMHSRDDTLAPVEAIYTLEQQAKNKEPVNASFTYFDNAGHQYIDKDKALGFPYGKQIADFILKH